jgi:hypothetical protein
VALPVILALTVGPPSQACFREHFLVESPLLSQADLRLELIDFRTDRPWDGIAESIFPKFIAGSHAL